jgi:hypothetical protein
MEMRVATPPRVAYQGEPGAYGEMAIAREWRGAATAVAAPTFADTIGLLGRGRVDYAIIPEEFGDRTDSGHRRCWRASRLETVSG